MYDDKLIEAQDKLSFVANQLSRFMNTGYRFFKLSDGQELFEIEDVLDALYVEGGVNYHIENLKQEEEPIQ